MGWQGNISKVTQEHVTQEKLDIRIIRTFRIAAQGLRISEIWKHKIIWLIVYRLQLLPSYDLSRMTRGYVLKVKKHLNGNMALKENTKHKNQLILVKTHPYFKKRVFTDSFRPLWSMFLICYCWLTAIRLGNVERKTLADNSPSADELIQNGEFGSRGKEWGVMKSYRRKVFMCFNLQITENGRRCVE